MAVTITNQTRERVLLRFNSGATRHLAPGEVLEGVEHVEVKGNTRVLSLHERRIILLERDEERAAREAREEEEAQAAKEEAKAAREAAREAARVEAKAAKSAAGGAADARQPAEA